MHVADELTPAEAMFAELAPMVTANDRPVLSYILGSLDDRGFIDTTVDEMALRLGVSPARVQAVLAVLRRYGPAGVGASNLRDCLLLQLERLEEQGAGSRLARQVVEGHLERLASGRLRAIAAALDATRAEVAGAAEFIRSRLRPYASLDPPQFQPAAPPAIPDVVIRERADAPGEFSVEILERRRVTLVVAASFAQAACAAEPPRPSASASTPRSLGREPSSIVWTDGGRRCGRWPSSWSSASASTWRTGHAT